MRTNDVTTTTTSLAANAGIRLGTAANVERAMPVVNSELISSTPERAKDQLGEGDAGGGDS